MSSSRGGLPKPVLNSPAQLAESNSNSAQMDTLITKLSFPDELEKNRKQVAKEEHKKRLDSMRKDLLNYIDATNWQFTKESGSKF